MKCFWCCSSLITQWKHRFIICIKNQIQAFFVSNLVFSSDVIWLLFLNSAWTALVLFVAKVVANCCNGTVVGLKIHSVNKASPGPNMSAEFLMDSFTCHSSHYLVSSVSHASLYIYSLPITTYPLQGHRMVGANPRWHWVRPGFTLDKTKQTIHTYRQYKVTNSPACLWTVGGSLHTWREPTQTRGEHAKSTQKGPPQPGIKPRTFLW